MWRTPRANEEGPRWLNACPRGHYDVWDKRHAPRFRESYAEELSTTTMIRTLGFMREFASMNSLAGQQTVLDWAWREMGPPMNAEGDRRVLTDEERRLMSVMLCQGDWPPEMAAGAERFQGWQ